MEKINTAVIGLGNIGIKYDLNNSFYKTHTKTLTKLKNYKICFTVDKNNRQRNVVKKKYGITSFKKIQDCPNIKLSLVVISLPTNQHLEICKKIIDKFSPKMILLEKPGGQNTSELIKIKNICKKNKCYLAINYIRRYDCNIHKIKKKFFTDKNIKKNFKYLKVYFKGSLKNTCSHYLNLINFLIEKFDHKKLIVSNYGKNFKIEKELFLNKQVSFLFFKSKNDDEIQFIFKDYILSYKNLDGNFYVIKNAESKKIKTNLKNYQLSVYLNILHFFQKKKKSIFSNYDDAIITHKIINRI